MRKLPEEIVKKPLMIRVDDETRESVRLLAGSDGISMAEWVRRLIKRSVAQRTA